PTVYRLGVLLAQRRLVLFGRRGGHVLRLVQDQGADAFELVCLWQLAGAEVAGDPVAARRLVRRTLRGSWLDPLEAPEAAAGLLAVLRAVRPELSLWRALVVYAMGAGEDGEEAVRRRDFVACAMAAWAAGQAPALAACVREERASDMVQWWRERFACAEDVQRVLVGGEPVKIVDRVLQGNTAGTVVAGDDGCKTTADEEKENEEQVAAELSADKEPSAEEHSKNDTGGDSALDSPSAARSLRKRRRLQHSGSSDGSAASSSDSASESPAPSRVRTRSQRNSDQSSGSGSGSGSNSGGSSGEQKSLETHVPHQRRRRRLRRNVITSDDDEESHQEEHGEEEEERHAAGFSTDSSLSSKSSPLVHSESDIDDDF
ncbi:hypothetical protein LPJ73_008130, partial [Coemansia sp. RSA 2703]